MIARKPDRAARVRSPSIQSKPDTERWQIPYQEYVTIVVAAKRFTKSARISISPDELLDCIHDACLKIESRPAYKAKISQMHSDHRLSYMLRCVKGIILDRYRAEAIKTRYNEQTRPLLQNNVFLSSQTSPEIDAAHVLREILNLFSNSLPQDKQAIRLLGFLLNGNFVGAGGNRLGRFSVERISAQISWPPSEVDATLRRIKRRCRKWIEENIDEADRDEMTFEEKLGHVISLVRQA